MMKLLQVCLLGSCALLTTTTFAEKHTLSLGYAQTDVQDVMDLDGVSLQYRYENESPLGFVSTLSYQTGEENWEDDDESYGKLEAKHLTILGGPAYRFNNFISAYAVGGLAHTKIEDRNMSPGYSESYELTETNFAYGAGVIINPTEQLAINIGYEGTKVDSVKLDGFNISAGYRF